MASGAITAHGTLLQVGSGLSGSTSTTWTTIADVEDINGPSESNTFIDITNHSSSAVERIPSLNDPGGVSLTISYQPDTVTHGATGDGLKSLLRSQTKRGWRIKWPTTGSDYDQWDGYVGTFNPTAPTADALRANVDLQISGPVSSTTG